MSKLSIFDIYKIGVGPSSSHTLGPWKAAMQFAANLENKEIDDIQIHLFGSLSKTGIGHATHIALQLGLEGFQPESIAIEKIDSYIQRIASERRIFINEKPITFEASKAIIFHNYSLPTHPNALTFRAFTKKKIVLEETYYSIGGGFIKKEGEKENDKTAINLPFPIKKGSDLLDHTKKTNLAIWQIVYKNELCFRDQKTIKKQIINIFDTILECVFKGCTKEGILPGGLGVKRRAKALAKSLMGNINFQNSKEWINNITKKNKDFLNVNKWISCFALAVNEENAALGRVVTSPTNGAAGVVPAVLLYYYCFCDYKGMKDIEQFLFTSGQIGSLFKEGATISAAVGGCQAEIGVSSAMAAGGLVELLGGSPKQVLMAAEIAMEHHLGLTCDPVRGLVQIPCIERNAMGAIKAITAANLALSSDPNDAIVNFDVVVKTMWDTAQQMSTKYKETSEGGLAINLPVNIPNC